MTRVFDHVTLGIGNIDRARHFYDPVMATLNMSLLWHTDTMLTYGPPEEDVFGLQCDGAAPRHGTHVAFRASDRAVVDRFHAAALAHGGSDAGQPGLRVAYHANYYAAFVTDPDGNRIEAVCHDPAT